MSVSPAEKLEHARRVCADIGIPMICLDTLAVDKRTAAKLLGKVSLRTVENLIDEGALPAFNVGSLVRIELIELVGFMERNRKVPRGVSTNQPKAKALALLDGAD